jgi:SnoaL-like domain
MTLTTDDRLAIHELVGLHGHLSDDRTPQLLDRLLTEDAVYDLEHYGMGTVSGLPALRALFEQAPGEQPVGHHVTNVLVTEQADGTARVRSKGLAVMADGTTGSAVYEDRVVRTPAGWRIAHRTVVPSRR